MAQTKELINSDGVYLDTEKDINEITQFFYEEEKLISLGSLETEDQRGYCKILLKKLTMEEFKELIKLAVKFSGYAYAPTISSFRDLEEKMVKLKSFIKRKRDEIKVKEDKGGQIVFGSDFSRMDPVAMGKWNKQMDEKMLMRI